jgi:hypothetical protein
VLFAAVMGEQVPGDPAGPDGMFTFRLALNFSEVLTFRPPLVRASADLFQFVVYPSRIQQYTCGLSSPQTRASCSCLLVRLPICRSRPYLQFHNRPIAV